MRLQGCVSSVVKGFSALCVVASAMLTANVARAEDPAMPVGEPMREWTFLVYLNGHNNLDRFGMVNLRDMEKVGSTDRVNVVVQWASMRNPKTKRLFVNKQTNPGSSTLASTVVEELPTVDMGDWHNLVEFVKWGAKKYPAKHYFVNVWNHGGGWHLSPDAANQILHPTDISWDDHTGHFIKTEDLGRAMTDIAGIFGHKVDIYGSDACLMAMAEVAGEMSNTVDTFVGSQEVEPGAGWPYDQLLLHWNALAEATPQAVSKVLAHDYVASYVDAGMDATMSVFDMSKIEALEGAVRDLAGALAKLPAASLSKVLSIARASQSFTYSDYVDLMDFSARMGSDAEFRSISELGAVHEAASAFTTYNEATSTMPGAHGLSIWLPKSKYQFTGLAARYSGLQFDKATGWSGFLKALLP